MSGITLYLLTKKGFDVLNHLLESKSYLNIIDAVIVGSDSNNAENYRVEIIELCNKYSIKLLDRLELYDNQSSYSIAIGWKWLIFDVNNLIVVHDSLLPKYRGFNPLVSCLLNKEEEIGATAIFANNEMDKGDIILQESVKISYPITILEASHLISNLYVLIISKIFNDINKNIKLNRISQFEKEATYSLWRDNEDYFINWNHSAEYLKRFVDAVGYPYDNAKSVFNEAVVDITDCEVFPVNFEIIDPGKVLFFDEEGNPIVSCGKDALILKSISKCGKRLKINKLRSRFK